MWRAVGIICLVLNSANGAVAQVRLSQPIACELGKTCVIQQFMDINPSKEVADFACGSASYDGHKGTDFRVSPRDLAKGVDVLAAADGVVVGLRDSMADRRVKTAADYETVKGKECGNGVVVRHDDDLETQYCHMKQNSVVVKKGQKVKQGDVLGHVGLSGKTQFPHLHLSVRKSGKPVDPFAPNKTANNCSFDSRDTLWDNGFAGKFMYQPTSVVQLGLSNAGVKMEEIVDGSVPVYSPDPSRPLVVYGLAVNGLSGDYLVLRISGPNGVVVENVRPQLTKRKAQWLAFAGKKAPAGGWPAGNYVGTVEILRGGLVLQADEVSFKMK